MRLKHAKPIEHRLFVLVGHLQSGAVGQFNASAFAFHILSDMREVDQVGFVHPTESKRGQCLFTTFQCPIDHESLFIRQIQRGLAALSLAINNFLEWDEDHALHRRKANQRTVMTVGKMRGPVTNEILIIRHGIR